MRWLSVGYNDGIRRVMSSEERSCTATKHSYDDDRRHARQQADRKHAAEAWQNSADDLTFTTRSGTPVEPRNFHRIGDTRCIRANVRKITVHDARRTCGTLLADLDVHPRVAIQVLRHAEFSITMEIYMQVSSKATRDALTKLGRAWEKIEEKTSDARRDKGV